MGSELADLIAKLQAARANGNPEYYLAMLSVAEAHRCAALLSAQEEQIERLRAELDETFTDEKGNVWHRPTAWAYYAACRALDAAKAALEGSKRDG